MITLGLPLAIGEHDVTQGATTVTMSAATWASPATYLEALLTALSEVATVEGVAPDKLRLESPFSPDDLVWENSTAGNLAAAYVGADSRVMAFNTDSEPTTYSWTGGAERLPGLQPQYRSWHQSTRSGQHGQSGTLIDGTLSVWASRGALSDLEAWYLFAQVWLAGQGAVELRVGATTTIWYLDQTDIQIDTRSSDGTYTTCGLPLVRGV
jgi:hypothetical protein